MKPLSAVCSTAVIAWMLTACSQGAGVDVYTVDLHDADVKAIQNNEMQWNQDFASKDIEKIVAHYADDAILMTPGATANSGKAAVRNAMQELVSDPSFSLKLQTSRVEVAKSDDIAYTQGTYTLTVTDPQTKQAIHDHGNYVTTYRKQPDGTWKAVADIATSDVPPPAPPAPSPAHSKPR